MYTGALDTGLLLFGLPVIVCDSDVWECHIPVIHIWNMCERVGLLSNISRCHKNLIATGVLAVYDTVDGRV